MIEEKDKNEVIMSRFNPRNLNYFERTSSELSEKSHIISTELNDKCLPKKEKVEKINRFKIILPIEVINKKKKSRLCFKYLPSLEIKRNKKKKTRQNQPVIARHKTTTPYSKDRLLDFDLFLEEIYLNKQDVIKNTVKKKKNKKKDLKNVFLCRKNSNLNCFKKGGLYDLDNFVVQSSQAKIIEKKHEINIKIPKFSKLDSKFFDLPNFKVNGREIPSEHCFNDEDISNNAYLNFHNLNEIREKDYRQNFYKKRNSNSVIRKLDYETNNPLSHI